MKLLTAKEAIDLLTACELEMELEMHKRVGFPVWIADVDGLRWVPTDLIAYVAGVEVHD